MTTTIKLTVPTLHELAKLDDQFVVTLSHAAAKEISEHYGKAITSSEIVKEALSKLDKAIVGAQVEAGRLLEHKIGQWDNHYNTGYRLRTDVTKYIEDQFEGIIRAKFEKWLESIDFDAVIDKIAAQYVEKKMDAVLKQQLGEFLRRW